MVFLHRHDAAEGGPAIEDLFVGPWRAELLRVEVIASEAEVQRLAHSGYEIGYREDWEQAQWTAYQSTHLPLGNATGRPSFRRDEMLFAESAAAEDYRLSGYDRGHLVPAQDMSWSDASYRDSFYYSNVAPQYPSFNRGPWRVLEEEVRALADNAAACWVVTGPLVPSDAERIGPNEVAVPDAFFKAVLWLSDSPPEWHGRAWVAPHRTDLERPLPCSIDRVEELSGLELFAALPDAVEEVVEARWDPE